MKKKEVQIIALSPSESSRGNFSIVLEEVLQKKRMVIIVGAFEAQAIAIHLEGLQLPRPLTHDIFKTTITDLGATIKEVIIHDIIDEMFHAWIICITIDQQEKKIDCRASDALALAVRFCCPIYVADFVLSASTIEQNSSQTIAMNGSLTTYTLEQLQSLLKQALSTEDYETASRIRDLIEKEKR